MGNKAAHRNMNTLSNTSITPSSFSHHYGSQGAYALIDVVKSLTSYAGNVLPLRRRRYQLQPNSPPQAAMMPGMPDATIGPGTARIMKKLSGPSLAPLMRA